MVRRTLRRARAGVVAAAALLVLLSAAPRNEGKSSRPNPVVDAPLSTYAQIHSAVLADYGGYSFKFTYLGAQLKRVPSLGGRAAMPFSLPAFVPYERDLDYGNETTMPDTIVLSPVLFKAFIDEIGTVPALTDTAFNPQPNASLMVFRGVPPVMCWEHLATRPETDRLFQMLRNHVTNPADTLKVSNYRRQMAGARR